MHRRVQTTVLLMALFVLAVGLTACRSAPADEPAPPTATATAALEPTPAPTPTATPLPAPTAPPTATPAPTTVPTATAPAETSEAEPLTLQVGVNSNFEPFIFRDETGALTGFDIDLMNALAAAGAFEVRYLGMPFEGMLRNALAPGQLDAAISAITVTEARRQIVAFTDVYLETGQGLAVRTGDQRIGSVADLTERTRLGIKRTTTGEQYARVNTNAELVPYDEAAPLVEALVAGNVDAVILDAPVLAFYAATSSAIALVDGPLTEEDYAIAVNAEHPEVVERLNAALAAIRADGTYDALLAKWFGEEMPGE